MADVLAELVAHKRTEVAARLGGRATVAEPTRRSLAAALARFDDAALRERFGAQGHARWKARFTLEHSARETRRLYAAAAEASGAD